MNENKDVIKKVIAKCDLLGTRKLEIFFNKYSYWTIV